MTSFLTNTQDNTQNFRILKGFIIRGWTLKTEKPLISQGFWTLLDVKKVVMAEVHGVPIGL